MGPLKRLEASTIIETVVALTVISILFGIATTLCVRLVTGTESIKAVKARHLLQLYADRTVRNREFFDGTEAAGGLVLERRIDPVAGAGGLINLHFAVADSNRVILSEWNQLVRNGK